MPPLRSYDLPVDTDVMYGGCQQASEAEYFLKDAPAFVCPKKTEGIVTMEDCLVQYREDNLMPPKPGKKAPPCYKCSKGAKVRIEFSERE